MTFTQAYFAHFSSLPVVSWFSAVLISAFIQVAVLLRASYIQVGWPSPSEAFQERGQITLGMICLEVAGLWLNGVAMPLAPNLGHAFLTCLTVMNLGTGLLVADLVWTALETLKGRRKSAA